MIAAAERLLALIEDGFLLVSCMCILAIVVITTGDVTARTLFNAPFAWSHDLITQYLLIAMFFLALPYVTRTGGHMALDFLARRVGDPMARTLLVLVGEILALLFIAGFVDGAWETTLDAYQGGDVLTGDLALPTWPSRLLGTLGAAVLALRLAVRFVQALAALARRDVPAYLSQDGHR